MIDVEDDFRRATTTVEAGESVTFEDFKARAFANFRHPLIRILLEVKRKAYYCLVLRKNSRNVLRGTEGGDL